ncbi:MAG: hypothetical protein HYX29_01260 [Solirubrobacterales bacterium]|nr:hypothetical protein [Solirubrobacterales bacterium]
MGYSSEERDDLSTPMCGANKKNGTRCRAFAGQGTDHLGYGMCKYHGGSTPAHQKHALSLQAKQRMVTLGGPIDVHPTDALLALLRATAGHVSWLSDEIQELEDLGGEEAKVLLGMYDSERDRLVRIGEACVRSGASEKQVTVQKSQAAMLASIVRDAANDAGLTPLTSPHHLDRRS